MPLWFIVVEGNQLLEDAHVQEIKQECNRYGEVKTFTPFPPTGSATRSTGSSNGYGKSEEFKSIRVQYGEQEDAEDALRGLHGMQLKKNRQVFHIRCFGADPGAGRDITADHPAGSSSHRSMSRERSERGRVSASGGGRKDRYSSRERERRDRGDRDRDRGERDRERRERGERDRDRRDSRSPRRSDSRRDYDDRRDGCRRDDYDDRRDSRRDRDYDRDRDRPSARDRSRSRGRSDRR